MIEFDKWWAEKEYCNGMCEAEQAWYTSMEEARKGYVELNAVYDALERYLGHIPPEIAEKLGGE